MASPNGERRVGGPAGPASDGGGGIAAAAGAGRDRAVVGEESSHGRTPKLRSIVVRTTPSVSL